MKYGPADIAGLVSFSPLLQEAAEPLERALPLTRHLQEALLIPVPVTFSSPIHQGMGRIAPALSKNIKPNLHTTMQTTNNWRANLLLLLTATIWGFSFVAQRQGMEHVQPFTFNGLRFAIGSLSLLPVILFTRRNAASRQQHSTAFSWPMLAGGFCLGIALFLGASLQQIGIVSTTAGKAGFITGLYVLIVPLVGLLWKQRTIPATWIGAILAVIGMYFLSVTDDASISRGDLLVLISAFFWAIHVQLISWLSQKFDALLLSLYQFLFCAILSLFAAYGWESVSLSGIRAALLPILYTGIFSVGIAYTLQVVAQKKAHPAHAAIILSLESVFAVLGGYYFLGEVLSLRGLVGCGLMLTGMFVSQLLSNAVLSSMARRLHLSRESRPRGH